MKDRQRGWATVLRSTVNPPDIATQQERARSSVVHMSRRQMTARWRTSLLRQFAPSFAGPDPEL